MSHDGTWRASCHITLHSPPFHFESSFQSTRRDKSRRWLWRLVGRCGEVERDIDKQTGLRSLTATLPFDQGSSAPSRTSSALAVRLGIENLNFRLPKSVSFAHTPRTRTSLALSMPFLFIAHKTLEAPPNVTDEPRRDLARLVPHHASQSIASFRKHIRKHEA